MSLTADELKRAVKTQKDIYIRLKNELVNYKKDGDHRKTLKHHENRILSIVKHHKEFMENHDEIIKSDIAETDDYFVSDLCNLFGDEYIDILSYIQNCRDAKFPPSVSQSSSSSAPGVTVVQTAPLPFKMPQFDIPLFTGTYTEWPSFYDQFLQVHNHKSMTVNHKFHILKNALSPKVKTFIGYLDITTENYETAFKALVDRYSNKRVLFSNYMEQFLNQSIITHETADQLSTLYDISRSSIFAIEKLGIKIDDCSEILAHLLLKKLPQLTRLEWEKQLGKETAIPKFNALADFIDLRYRTLEAIEPQTAKAETKIAHANSSKDKSTSHSSNKSVVRKETQLFHVSAKSISCPLCPDQSHAQKPHVLRNCFKFQQLTPPERKVQADKLNVCNNCLGHKTSQSCISTNFCKLCQGKHHTLLHFNRTFVPINSSNSNASLSTNIPPMIPAKSIHSNNLTSTNSNYVLLSTAQIDIRNSHGELIRFRALVDQGAQHSIITERAYQRLKLKSIPICIGVKPMGASEYKIVDKGLDVNIHSIINNQYTVDAKVAIIPTITSDLPLYPLKTANLQHVKGLPLADPQFATPGQIDLLLAGDVYGKIIQSGLCKGQIDEPIAQNTSLGWILSGELAHQNHFIATPVNMFHVSVHEIGEYMKRFHEIEEVSSTRTLSKEDEWTEKFYEQTIQRQPNGKFLVRLPFKSYFDSTAQIGSSYATALNRFKSLQRRFSRDPQFRNEYTNAINDYKQTNQMKLVDTIYDQQTSSDVKHFYLPHHAVFKASSLTTKIRPVFDASAKTSNGKSLNDILTTGPKLQSDSIAMLLNWRCHKFVFIADISKMYRCIDLHPDDTNYHLILWQDNEQSAIQTYALQTVTFGVASSAYLAIKTLHKLAELERNKYPLAYEAIKKETYVDDVVSGGETINAAINVSTELIQMLRGGGFELRKWASNSSEILKHIPIENQNQDTTCLLNSEESIKTLGLGWNTVQDEFIFSCNFQICFDSFTKRTTMSTIARLYDPLGWINPYITKAKMFLSKLWQQNIEWDDPFSPSLSKEWTEIVTQLQHINQIKIPRWLNTTSKNVLNELHVFCDSSQNAYSVAIYLRTIDSENNIHSNLIIAKSKLTPVSKPLTIPRAELCGAVLAVKILKTVLDSLQITINQVFMWTDSVIVLSWIRGDPNRWAIFVGNRVNKILEVSKIDMWRHVISQDNPADCNSRGLNITQLIEYPLWWNGPEWLLLPQSEWPASPFNLVEDDPAELKSKFKSINVAINEPSKLDNFIGQFSSFNSLRRSIAYCFRFVQNVQNILESKPKGSPKYHSKTNPNIQLIPPLTVIEVRNAEISLMSWLQSELFPSEIRAIQESRMLPKQSKLHHLNPFIDNQNVLRVNGRLRNAHMPFNEKYPIILPSKHRIAYLIVKHYHLLTLHGGPRLTANQIRQNYWILNVRNFARHFIFKCTICFAHKPKTLTQQMGALPFPRVNDRSRPFAATIVDYAGPFHIKASNFRGVKSYKGYVAIFTCMSTKAVHLEAAGDMTSQTFLHAFERFIARRGYCHDIYSDNGGNFTRSFKDLDANQKIYLSSYTAVVNKKLIPYLTTRHIQWHFSPPYSPHFNGLVEAAVKSMKFHLIRVIGQSKLSFEHFSTVLTRIEAVLNSRPISPTSDNVNDFTALTPGHFLTGNALLARPQPPADEKPVKQYQLMEKMVQHFWQRFRSDILSSMQIRNKWKEQQPNIKKGDLVIVKEDNLPVNQWPLARIEELHPGADGLIRVATIRFSDSTMLKRSIAKLCLVPMDSTAQNASN